MEDGFGSINVKSQTLSVLHTLARHYKDDARDFLNRFNILWEAQLHKTGRIKSFVDLIFACECALKVHMILSRINDEPRAVYMDLRRLGHNISALADTARFLSDRSLYQFLKDRFGPLSVFVRYSFDAYETFFPSAMDRERAPINYSKTIGNNTWVLECQEHVSKLLQPLDQQLGVVVTDSLQELGEHELRMKEFVDECMRREHIRTNHT